MVALPAMVKYELPSGSYSVFGQGEPLRPEASWDASDEVMSATVAGQPVVVLAEDAQWPTQVTEASGLRPLILTPEGMQEQQLLANEPQGARVLRLPKESVEAAAHPHLNGQARGALAVLEAILITSGFAAGIPVEEISVRPFLDPEEGWTKINVAASVGCSAAQALAFWDYVGHKVDEWRRTLDPHQADFVAQAFSVYVDW